MSDTINAPFTPEQVEALNWYQRNSGWHPFTCGNDRTDEAHMAYQKEHGGDWGELVAHEDGWHCPACDYRQGWAHQMMVDVGKAKRNMLAEALTACGVKNLPA